MGFFTDIYIVYSARTFWRLVNLVRSHRWSKATAIILGVHVNDGLYESVEVDYEYGFDVPMCASTFVKPFIFKSSARTYADHLKPGMEFRIRINPQNPKVSLADRSEENLW
jgi:hypothetical protein